MQKSGDAASGCDLYPCFNLKLVRDPISERSLSGIRMKRFNSALKHRLKVEGLQGGEHQLPFKPVKGFLNETEWKWLQLRRVGLTETQVASKTLKLISLEKKDNNLIIVFNLPLTWCQLCGWK